VLPLPALTEATCEVIWTLPAEELAAAETAFAAFFRVAGVSVEALLAEFPDETLALCVQKHFFFRQAFEEWLVTRYEDSLRGFFLRRTRDPERSRDLVQDFYVKLLEGPAIQRYDPCRPFRTWYWQVVRNFLIDEQRGLHPTEELGETPFLDPDPFEQAVAAELRRRVDEVIDSLPLVRRQVLRATMQGRQPADLAQELGLPIRQVYRHLFQARRAVERELSPPAPGQS
jgi:RNA polymerase sigma factor (sigma-70 family)